jgi:methyl-accepting chemotaxis protein
MAVPAHFRMGAWALGGAAAAAYATRRIGAHPAARRAELVRASAPLPVAADVVESSADATPADDLGEPLRKLNKRMKAVERSTAELAVIRKRLDQVSKSTAHVAELSETLPKLERRMREVAHATAMLPELLNAVERMTKSIDRLADRLPADKP